MEVADRIVVMNAGRIEQIGSPAEIYDHPATPFVMRFVGEVNEIFPNEYVRPQDLELHDEPKSESLPAVLKRVIHLGKETQAELQLDDGRVIHAQLSGERADAAKNNGLANGARLHVLPRSRRRFG